MPNVRLIAINGSGGALTTINASIPCRRMEIVEDEAVTAQGLIYQTLFDGFAKTYQVTPSSEPIIIQESQTQGRGDGPILGFPEQNLANGTSAFNYRAADPIAKVKSAGAAGNVRVTEFE